MPFIGNQPALSYTSFAKQDFTTSATTSYTLDHPVTNENEIALFINFVRQEPTTAYTASGTTLTLTSATSASDDMYCVFLGKAVQTVNAPDGSVGNSQVASTIITGQTAETSIATDDTVLIHDTSAGALRKMTRANFVSGVGGNNTPSFYAYRTTTQSVANNTATEIVYPTEVYDTDSAYDTSTGRFTPQEAGKYFCSAWHRLATGTDLQNVEVAIRKNGSATSANPFSSVHNDSYNTAFVSGIIDLNGSTDYVSAFAFQFSGGSLNIHTNGNGFHAFKLIGV